MTVTTDDLQERIAWYQKQLAPYCHKRAQPRLAEVAQNAIEDIRTGRGLCLDAAYCERIGFAPPEAAARYSPAEALHLALVTPEYYPDTGKQGDETEPEAIYAALGLRLLEKAEFARSQQKTDSALALLDQVSQLRDMLADETRIRPAGESHPNLKAESRREYIADIRSQAVRASDRYETNAAIREPVIQYFNDVRAILVGRSNYGSITDDQVATFAINAVAEIVSTNYKKELLSLLPDDRKSLAQLATALLEEFRYDLELSYLRRVVTNYISGNYR